MRESNVVKPVFFSRYTHVFRKGNLFNGDEVFAYYHSLRLKPLYVNRIMHECVQDFVRNNDINMVKNKLNEKDLDSFKKLIDTMVNYKIIIVDKTYDDKVIATIKNSLPEPYISVCYFIMTEFCNLACSYCFIENGMDANNHSRKIMSKETVKKGLDYYCKQISLKPELFNQEKSIIIYGGEPLTNFDNVCYLLDLIVEYKNIGKLPYGLKIALLTNGTLMTDEIAEKLSEYDVSISISLDGADEEANSCRKYQDGDMAYANIRKGIDIAMKHGLDCGLSVTLTDKSLDSVDKMEKIIDETGVSSLGFNMIMTDEHYQVSSEYNNKSSQFVIDAFKVFRKKGIYEDRMMRKLKAFHKAKLYLFDCAATGGNQMVIAPDGQVGCCHGYLYNREYFPSTVDNIDFNPVTNDDYLAWARRTPVNMPECHDCVALGICGGGCALTAKKSTGDLMGLDERFCVHAKMTLEWMIWDLFNQMNGGEYNVDPLTDNLKKKFK